MTIISTPEKPRYSDMYGMMSYKDWLTMDKDCPDYQISLGADKP